MKKIHFFKIHTRLGITVKPIHQKEFNYGVEDGSDAILTKAFLQKLNATVDAYTFPTPEEIEKIAVQQELYKHSVKAAEMITGSLKKNEIQFVIGGDHSVTFLSFLAVLKRFKNTQKIGYIQFDSHGDMNLYKDSPTKNFHGMYVRPFIDNFDLKDFDALVEEKLPTENVWFIGNLDLDNREKIFFKKAKIKNTSTKDMKNKKEILREFENFVKQFEHIHVTIDVDVFDKSQVLATGIPAEHGFMWNDVKFFLEIVKKQKSISIDISEVNSKKKGAKQTIALTQKMIRLIVG